MILSAKKLHNHDTVRQKLAHHYELNAVLFLRCFFHSYRLKSTGL
jgi:hypothetical protein